MAKPDWINRTISNVAKLFVYDDKTEERSVRLSDTSGMLSIFNISESGIAVTEETALGISSLWRAVDLMASLIATMPKKLYHRQRGSIEEAVQHPSSILVNYLPDDEYPPFDFWYAMVANAYLNGGGGAEIIRDKNGRPVRLRLMRYGCTPYKLSKNDKLFFYDNEDAQVYDPADVLYIPGLLVTDGTKARSILQSFRDTFGEELSQKQMVSNFLKTGPFPGGTYTYTGKLSDLQKDAVTNSFRKKFGGAAHAGDIIPLGNGENFTQLKPVSFTDAKLVDMKNIRTEDVARMFGIPISLLMSLDKPSYNSLEQLFKQFLVTTLDPRVTRIDQELNRKLLRRSEMGAYYFESEVDEIMWMTAADRSEYWWKQFQMGAITSNEIRAYLNRNPVEGGNEPMVQVNMTTLKLAQSADLTNQARRRRSKEVPNPKQTILFEETITAKKNGQHSTAAEN